MHSCCNTKRSNDQISDYATKVRLENRMIPALRRIFRQMLEDYNASLRAFGRPIDAKKYQPRFQAVLHDQYTVVQNAFRGRVIEDNNGKAFVFYHTKQNEEQVTSLIDMSLIDWRDENALKKSLLITQTNQRQMAEAQEMSMQTLMEDDQDITPAVLAAVATGILRRKYGIRSNTISTTETQESAESTKQIEATAISGTTPFNMQPGTSVPSEIQTTKTWRDMDDSRVRPTHQAVDNTTLRDTGIFIVGGSQLRFPGDTSLLADISQTINCRCEAEYRVL